MKEQILHEKVYVTNILEDTIILLRNRSVHRVVCDCHEIKSGKTEKKVIRILSGKKYKQVMERGYYDVGQEDAEQEVGKIAANQ